MRIAVTAPIFVKNNEHLEWLNKTTKSIVSTEHDVIFIPVENYIAPEYKPLIYKFDHNPLEIDTLQGIGENQSVANAWNQGIKKAKELNCDYVIVINTDLVFKYNLIDRLVAFAQNRQEAEMWTASEHIDEYDINECAEDENYSEHPHFSCYMVRPSFFENVGEFDENFKPAYCEDGDMHARLSLANKKAYIYGGAKFYHKRSNTIKTDAELWNKNANTFPKNQKYFEEKWGSKPVNTPEEMRVVYFKHPFNQEDKPLSYWESRV